MSECDERVEICSMNNETLSRKWNDMKIAHSIIILEFLASWRVQRERTAHRL